MARAKRALGIMVVSLFLIGLLEACVSRNASDAHLVADVPESAVSTAAQEAGAGMNTVDGTEHPTPRATEGNLEEASPAASPQETRTVTGTEHPTPQAVETIPAESGQAASQQRTPTVTDTERPVPQELEIIPEGYYQAADQQGTLVELTYDTYESRTYEQKSKELTKRAIVYLPYGYSEETEYNVFYLMHGGWGNEATTLGTPDHPNALKNVIDHAIQNGEIAPLIIVCPTYNNESPEDSGDYTLAFYTLMVNYHNELVNDLIPAVE